LPEVDTKFSLWLPAIAVAAGLLTLIPPAIIGTGTSALAVQSLEHWMHSTPDTFEALHVHWLWAPRVIAFITGNAFAALVAFRAIVIALSVFLLLLTAQRLFDDRRAMIGGAMLALNITILYLSHTFGTQLLTLLAANALLYLFTSPTPRDHRLGALIFGLSLSIGFWPFILLIAILTVGLNLHHTLYTPRAKQTYILFGLIVIGAAAYLLLELFYFGGAHLWAAMNPRFFLPRGISLIAQGLIIAVFSINLLFAVIFRRKPGGIAREFQSAFLILGIFFITNLFGREEMLQDVAILLPCLILVALDRIERIGTIGLIIIVVNLGLFLFLPSFQANSELALPIPRRVSSQDEIAFSYYKTFDLFSYRELREEQRGEVEVQALLSTERLDSTLVLINSSTDTWFDAATLGAEFPQANFGWFYGQPINLVRIDGLKDTAFIRSPPTTPYLSGLFEKSFARQFIDSTMPRNVPVQETEHFQFIDCRGNDSARHALIDRLTYLQYAGFHHR
jgi:hypothetical protein